MLDTANPVRKGEEIDSNAVTEYLKSRHRFAKVSQKLPNFQGCIQLDIPPKYTNRDLILRRPPKGT